METVTQRFLANDDTVTSFMLAETKPIRMNRVAIGRIFPTRRSFGGVGSTASLPCRMSHASIPESVRQARHPPEDPVRLSIGLEDPDDPVADLERALDTGASCSPKTAVDLAW